MIVFSLLKDRFFRIKTLLVGVATFFLVGVIFLFSACSEKVDYFSYVSELRDNIFLANTQELSLRAYSLSKESPYVADGIVREVSKRTEIYLTAPSGDKEYELFFTVNGKRHGGDMSFDNVKGEYYYFCTLDVSALTQIEFELVCGEETTLLCANSIVGERTISPKQALQTVVEHEGELFQSLTDKYGFAGEIYMRLLYEDAPYYYVGIVDRNGNTTALLLNGETGKILAKRQTN